jgi:hypothetical protein
MVSTGTEQPEHKGLPTGRHIWQRRQGYKDSGRNFQ